ncbi:MAG: D-glycero-alpha-D-manno-heptose-1,7-bisphosphate 7-phosphatase [Candidatus Cyclobacteriaceae bacterium M3_2C_046]
MNKCIFLDRDGVLNKEIGDYAYQLDHFIIEEGVPETLKSLKDAGYLLVVVTNQAGISRGLYTISQMKLCHQHLINSCRQIIDAIYFCPYHPSVTASLCRKPDSLMFEKAIARFNIDVAQSWMIGDSDRDMIPARKLGIKTIQVGLPNQSLADYTGKNLYDVTFKYILASS